MCGCASVLMTQNCRIWYQWGPNFARHILKPRDGFSRFEVQRNCLLLWNVMIRCSFVRYVHRMNSYKLLNFWHYFVLSENFLTFSKYEIYHTDSFLGWSGVHAMLTSSSRCFVCPYSFMYREMWQSELFDLYLHSTVHAYMYIACWLSWLPS